MLPTRLLYVLENGLQRHRVCNYRTNKWNNRAIQVSNHSVIRTRNLHCAIWCTETELADVVENVGELTAPSMLPTSILYVLQICPGYQPFCYTYKQISRYHLVCDGAVNKCPILIKDWLVTWIDRIFTTVSLGRDVVRRLQ